MGIMASREAATSEPVDAPPAALKEGLSFKDAVLEPAAPPPSGKRGSPRGAKTSVASASASATAAQPAGAPRTPGKEEGKGVVAAVAETTEAAARTTVAATGIWRPFRFLARKTSDKLDKLTRSKRFLDAVEDTFKECDLDGNGRIAAAELYVAVLLLYHRINSWPLGGGLKKPPARAEVLAAMERHDAGRKGYLTREEFTAASQDLFKNAARGIGKQMLVMIVLSPIVAHYTRKLMDKTLGRIFPSLGKGFQQYVPDFIFAPALATTILTTVTPILFDRYDAHTRMRAARKAGATADAGKKRA